MEQRIYLGYPPFGQQYSAHNLYYVKCRSEPACPSEQVHGSCLPFDHPASILPAGTVDWIDWNQRRHDGRACECRDVSGVVDLAHSPIPGQAAECEAGCSTRRLRSAGSEDSTRAFQRAGFTASLAAVVAQLLRSCCAVIEVARDRVVAACESVFCCPENQFSDRVAWRRASARHAPAPTRRGAGRRRAIWPRLFSAVFGMPARQACVHIVWMAAPSWNLPIDYPSASFAENASAPSRTSRRSAGFPRPVGYLDPWSNSTLQNVLSSSTMGKIDAGNDMHPVQNMIGHPGWMPVALPQKPLETLP